jgi:hypothetical protein
MEPGKRETFSLRRAVCIAAVNAGKDFNAILILGALEHETNV